MQGFYGMVVIIMTIFNYILHKVLDVPNQDAWDLLDATAAYRKVLLPDIGIKLAGLVLALTIWPPAMMFSVLIAAIFILTAIHLPRRKKTA